MPISYDKLLKIFQENDVTCYSITKKDKIIGQGTWKNIQDGKNINTNTIEALCKYFNCQPGDILDYIPEKSDMNIHAEIKPQYIYLDFPDMSVSAGTGHFLDNEECNVKLKVDSTPITQNADFALKVHGDSMEPDFFNDDIVLVKKVSMVDIGDVGIFVLNDVGYIKQFGGDRLISFNGKYPDIILSEGDSLYCMGKVIGKL